MAIEVKIRDDQRDMPACPPGADKIVFVGGNPDDFDEEALLAALGTLDCKASIRHVKVGLDSNLRNCKFLEHFPHAITLWLHGRALATTEGLGRAQSPCGLFMTGARRNKVRLDELEASPIDEIDIVGARAQDIAHIAAAESIERLQLTGGELTDLAQLNGSRSKELTLVGGKLTHVTGTMALPRLEALWFEACTKLQAIAEEDDKVRELTITACNNLDMSSVTKLRALNSITIMNCRQTIRLDGFNGLARLSYLALTNCKIDTAEVPVLDLPGLRKLWMHPIKDTFVRPLSERNPRILICNGKATYLNGEARSVQAFYE
jgi:hypothetical protein